MKKIITTKSGRKILLREPNEDDVVELMEMFNKIVTEDVYIMVNEKQTFEEEKKYLESVLKDVAENKMVKIFAFDGDKMIGNCDVRKGRYRSSHVGLFGLIIRKEYRGDGIGSQLTETVIQLAKERMGLKIVELHVYSENEPARKLYKKLGFVECGVLPGAISYRDRFIDQIHMYKNLK